MQEERVQPEVASPSKRNYRTLELALLLVLGILVGFSVKTEAAKRITMGSSDYLLSQKDAGAYDLNAMQKELSAKGDSAGLASPQPTGGSCSQ
ncbi:MAG: hypothetical protein PHT88_00625 [Candidatus Moranbacteria bacterium]|nr:hypothetical protein [Candidatus Moranbacteria bacterium]